MSIKNNLSYVPAKKCSLPGPLNRGGRRRLATCRLRRALGVTGNHVSAGDVSHACALWGRRACESRGCRVWSEVLPLAAAFPAAPKLQLETRCHCLAPPHQTLPSHMNDIKGFRFFAMRDEQNGHRSATPLPRTSTTNELGCVLTVPACSACWC